MLEYVVHSCVEVDASVQVQVEGRGKVRALMPGLVVELVQAKEDQEQGHGDAHGHTFRLVPTSDRDMDRQKELFTPGNRVRLNFTRVKEPADESR